MKRQGDSNIQPKTSGEATGALVPVRRRRQVIEIPILTKPSEAGPSPLATEDRKQAAIRESLGTLNELMDKLDRLIETDPPTRRAS